jgi:cytochrome c
MLSSGRRRQGRDAFVWPYALSHTIDRGEPNGFGPKLAGMLDRKAGSVPGFKYSSAFKSTAPWGSSGDVLGAWILAPATMVPGTTTGVFQSVADRDRGDIVAYLAAHMKKVLHSRHLIVKPGAGRKPFCCTACRQR